MPEVAQYINESMISPATQPLKQQKQVEKYTCRSDLVEYMNFHKTNPLMMQKIFHWIDKSGSARYNSTHFQFHSKKRITPNMAG